MRDDPAVPESPWVPFGPFALSQGRGEVRFRGTPLPLDGKGFQILAALIEARGADVPATHLRHRLKLAGERGAGRLWDAVAALNEVLDMHASGAGQVAYHPATGYSMLTLQPSDGRAPPVFGRDDVIWRVAAQARARRMVTIAGPGGMGKTTVAMAVARRIAAAYADGVCHVDLSPLGEGRLLVGAVAAALGVPVPGGLPDLAAQLRDRHVLIVLDSCEHVVEAAAGLVDAVTAAAARVHVLATSREPLRAAGEWVQRLGPLPLPAADGGTSAAEALGFSGIQLFVERARAACDGFELCDACVATVVETCRRLDGVPLALELAAARVGLLGVDGLAAQVRERMLQLGGRRRDAPQRHRTLESLVGWSYELLSPIEQCVMQRLSVFRGGFTMAAALQVACDADVDPARATEVVLDLVAKSLLARADAGGEPAYRLLDITRAFMAARLAADPEQAAARRRHAQCVRALLAQAEVDWDRMTRPEWRAAYDRWVNDVRAALDWAFADPQTEEFGLELISMSMTLADQTSLMSDFAQRVEHSLDMMRRLPRQPLLIAARLNTLPAYFGVMHDPQRRSSLQSTSLGALELAQTAGTAKHQSGPLTALWVDELQLGRYAQALGWSHRMRGLAQASDDPVLGFIARRTEAQSQHFLGHQDVAQRLAEDVLADGTIRIPIAYAPSPIDPRVSMRIVLARVLWLRGRSASASGMVDECLAMAEADTPTALCQALALAAVPVALWCGEWPLARQRLERLRAHLQAHPIGYWNPWCDAMDAAHRRRTQAGEPAGLDWDAETASELLRDHLVTFDPGLLQPATLARARLGEAGWCTPEVLRVHGEALRHGGSPLAASEAAELLQEARVLARTQASLAWELRAAMSLADLWRAEGRSAAAHALVLDVRSRYVETGPNPDLASADARLEDLARA